VNDISHNIPQDTIIKNLTTIIETLQTNDIKPVLTTVTLLAEHYKSKNPVEQNKKIKELNKQIFKLAKDKNINLIDLNQFVSNENFCNPEFVVKDGIHFSDKTYIIWKQEIEKVLTKESI
jgi:lysophospholipase L1-like esterase